MLNKIDYMFKFGKIAYKIAEAKIKGRYKPFFLSHLVTSRCNFLCNNCLWKGKGKKELSTNEIVSFYQQAKQNGFVANYIWGGEPLIREDIAELVGASHKNNWLTIINTNGWFLEEKIDRLRPYVDGFVVSLDGAKPSSHDKLKKADGSYERAITGIKTAKEAGIPVIVNCLILKENQDELHEIIQLWKSLGVLGYMNFIEQDLLTSGGFEKRKAGCDVPEEKKKEIAYNLLQLKQAGEPLLNSSSYFRKFAKGTTSYRCHFPKIFLEVYSNGDVIDCTQVDKPLGNIRDTPLEELLNHSRIKGMVKDGEEWCCVHNNADRIDTSNLWEFNPEMILSLKKFL